MKISAIALFAAVVTSPAAAATILVSSFSAGGNSAAVRSGSYVIKNFGTFEEGNLADGYSTAVGNFSTLGGTGSGGTVSNADFSNDTLGISWMFSLGSFMFDRILPTLTDATDAGAMLTIRADGSTNTISGLGDSAQKFIEIDVGTAVSSASVFFSNDKLDDGFSIDDVALSVIPLPATGLLLLGGIGGLAAVGRRRKAGNLR